MTARSAAPTLEDVAAQAGVSRATASRVVNGDARVSDHTREAVRQAIRELGYTPNRAARSLVTRRTESIAVVVPETDARLFSDPFFAGTLHAVTEALTPTQTQVVLLVGRADDQDGRMGRYLRGGHTDGAIIVSHHSNDVLWRTAEEVNLPVVFLGRPFAPHPNLPYVDVDNVAGAELAVAHLVAQGRRRIGTVAGPADMSAGADRLVGWRKAMAEAGLAECGVEVGDFTPDGGAAAMRRLLAAHPDVDAVFVASDLMAAAALSVLSASGRGVPEDVALVGFDNLELATHTDPPLTTVINPVAQMAAQAVALLLAQLEGGTTPAPVTMTTELVVRASA